jgi:hypothetical protein
MTILPTLLKAESAKLAKRSSVEAAKPAGKNACVQCRTNNNGLGRTIRNPKLITGDAQDDRT